MGEIAGLGEKLLDQGENYWTRGKIAGQGGKLLD